MPLVKLETVSTVLLVVALGAAGCTGGGGSGGAAGAASATSEDVAAVEKLSRSDPEKALVRCRELVAAGEAGAGALMPKVLHAAYVRHKNAKRWAEAEKMLAEATEGWPDAKETGWIATDWPAQRTRWAKACLEQGDVVTAGRLVREMMAGDAAARDPSLQHLDVYRDLKIAQWRQARESDDSIAAGEHLADAAAVIRKPGSWTPLVDALDGEMSGAEILALAEQLEAEKPAAALGLATIARQRLDGRREGEARVRADALFARAAAAIADDVAAGRVATIPAEAAKELFEIAERAARDDPRRARARDGGLLKRRVAEVDELIAQKRHGEAEKLIRRLTRKDAVELWFARRAAPGADPWKDAPPEIVERVDREQPKGSPASRLALLRRLAEAGAWRPDEPAVAGLDALLPGLYAGWAEQLLGSHHVERALAMMRPLIRAAEKDEPARRCADALRAAIRRYLAAADLGRLFECTSFYVAELGPPASGDPFRAELRGALERAGEGLAKSSPSRRLFVLSLLAECFGDEAAGASAREAVLAEGFALIEKAAFQEEGAEGAPSVATGLTGVSAVAHDNATTFHILLFYDGPERFFVRLDPLRRGTLALKDGEYRVGVVGSTDSVRPYRGERAFASRSYFDRWVVKREGEAEPSLLGVPDVAGPYALLRAPENITVTVDPATGAARAD